MIIYLFVEELFIIKALCIWCTVIHVVGFLLFVVIVTTAPQTLTARSESPSGGNKRQVGLVNEEVADPAP